MTKVIDAEGSQLHAVNQLVSFRDRRVLEIGCGDGRLTKSIARDASIVLAIDPDQDAISAARTALPPSLTDAVTYKVAAANEVHIPRSSIDLVFFSWSL